MIFDNFINDDLRKRVGLCKLYPYSIEQGLTHAGERCAGLAEFNFGELILDADLQGRNRIVSVYLHEVGHLIAAETGIDNDPSGRLHNQHFACLVAVMFRRAGLLDRLKVYDFDDTNDSEKTPLDGELISRFAYVVRRSAQLAPLPLTIEQIARKLYHEDVYPAWTTKEPKKKTGEWLASREFISWMLGVAVGVIATASIAAVAIPIR